MLLHMRFVFISNVLCEDETICLGEKNEWFEADKKKLRHYGTAFLALAAG